VLGGCQHHRLMSVLSATPSSKARNPSEGKDSSLGVSLAQSQCRETVNVPFPTNIRQCSFFSLSLLSRLSLQQRRKEEERAEEPPHSNNIFHFFFPRRAKCTGMLDSGCSFANLASDFLFRRLSVNSATYHFAYNRLTRVQSLLTRKPSPLQSSITSIKILFRI